MTTIPDGLEPEDSGSAGTQSASTSVVPVESTTPALQNLPIVQTLSGLANSRLRPVDALSQVTAAVYHQLCIDLQRARDDLQKRDDELRTTNAELARCQVDNATLRERVTSAQSHRNQRDFGIVVSSILLALGIPLVPTTTGTLYWIGWVLAVLGGLGLAAAWLLRDRRDPP